MYIQNLKTSMQIQSNTEYSNQEFNGLTTTDDIDESRYEYCKFKNCNFSSRTFTECVFEECRFENCDLSLTKLEEVRFSDTTFKNCKLTGVDFSDIGGFVIELDFDECNLQYSVWNNLDLKSRTFNDCNLREAVFMGCNLESAKFSGSDLHETRFEDCDLRKSDFRGAINYFVRSDNNRINDAQFSLPEAQSLLKNLPIRIDL